MKTLSGLRIPLRDGVELAADAFLAADGPAGPAIVELTPYGRGPGRQNFGNEGAYWVRHGYVLVIVECRGTGDSGGRFAFTLATGGDGDDGYDVVEWIAAQPWCNGRVGLRGASYSGSNQWQVARQRPPSLRAIVPNASGTGVDDVAYDGGIFHFNWALTWPAALAGSQLALTAPPDWAVGVHHRPLRSADTAVLRQTSALYQELLDHPPDDATYWAGASFSAKDYAGMDVPVLAFSGWFDGTLRGTLEHDRHMRAASRQPVHLIVGPWEHGTCSEGGYSYLDGKPVDRVGDALLPPQAFLPGLAITRQFYDRYLKGEGEFDHAPVQLYLTGSDRWIHADRWPPAGAVQRPLYLHSGGQASGLHGDGRLGWDAPGDEPPDSYRYAPTQPAFNTLSDLPGAAPGLPHHMVDMAPLIDRPDVLVYCSEAGTAPLDIVGDVTLVLHIVSDAPDTDFVCRLEDLAPDGRARRLGSRECGQLQARWRLGFQQAVLLQPGQPAVLRLRLGGIGHTLMPGHRLRLSVTSSAYPRMAPNPNTGDPIADDASPPRIAGQQVLHQTLHPSHLVLPCLD